MSLETLKRGLPIRVKVGAGDVEVCASARNAMGWGAIRTQKQRRAARFCMELGSEESDAHTAAELGRKPAAAEIPTDDVVAAPAVPAPTAHAWDAAAWLRSAWNWDLAFDRLCANR